MRQATTLMKLPSAQRDRYILILLQHSRCHNRGMNQGVRDTKEPAAPGKDGKMTFELDLDE
jgi:hypothetical protein